MRFTRLAACAMAAATAACTDQGPAEAHNKPEITSPDAPMMAVACEASIGSATVTCRAPSAPLQGVGRSAVLIGSRRTCESHDFERRVHCSRFDLSFTLPSRT